MKKAKTRLTIRISTFIMAICCIAMMTTAAFAAADISAFNVPGLTISAGSPSFNATDWTVTENGASVSGSSFFGVFNSASGDLVLTAEEAGTVTFDYTVGSGATMTINSAAYAGNGSFSEDVAPGGTITIAVTFTGTSTAAVTLSNISVAASEKEYITVNSSDYETLNAAVTAVTGDNVIGTVIVDENTTLSTDLIIPESVTLVVPYSADDTGSITANVASGAVVNGTAYSTLTVSADATLTINGNLIVSGNQQSTTKKAGCLTGNFGKIDLSGDLVINGTLYARGEISGTGSVTVNSGSAVYQLFQIMDWRGGQASLSAYQNNIFPFNLYEIKNITAETTYYNGASLIAQYYIYASSTNNVGNIVILGDDGLLKFASNDSSDYVVETFDTNGIATITINGSIQSHSLSITAMGNTIDSTNTVSPFGYNMNVIIAKDGLLEITGDLKMLPGCDITVQTEGTLTVDEGVGLYVYSCGEGGYSSTYNYAGWTANNAATLTVDSGANVSGTIASTDAAFANVDGFNATETTVTVNEVTQSNTSVTVVPVTFYVGAPAASSVEE